MRLQGERSQVYPRRPPIGPGHQVGHVGRAELNVRGGPDQRCRLRRGKPQFPHPDLGQVSGRPHPGHRQRGIRPCDQYHQRRWRQMEQQGSDLLVAVRLRDHVIVVEHENDRVRQGGQRVDEHGKHCRGDVRDLGAQFAQHVLAIQVRAGPLERTHDVPPEPRGIVVAPVKREPRERPALDRGGSPLRDQRGLAEACRSLHEDQFGWVAANRWTSSGRSTQSWSRSGRVELGLDRHVQD